MLYRPHLSPRTDEDLCGGYVFQANSLHLHQQMVHTTIPNHKRNNPGGHTFSAAVPALLPSSHCLCREAAYYWIPDDHHLPDSVGLPPVDFYIYVEWQEESSEEHDGWYHCQVEGYQPDGQAILRYRDGASETINISSIKWSFAWKSHSAFLSIGSTTPQHPMKKIHTAALQPKMVKMTARSIMGYADDTALISASPEDH